MLNKVDNNVFYVSQVHHFKEKKKEIKETKRKGKFRINFNNNKIIIMVYFIINIEWKEKKVTKNCGGIF